MLLLPAFTLRYSVRAEGGRVVVVAEGHEMVGSLFTSDPLAIRLDGQTRYSTRQILVRDRGPLRNGLAILSRLVAPRKESDGPEVFPLPLGERMSFLHFNPFRASFVMHQAGRDLRVEMNVPDNRVELWRDGQKLQEADLAPPWPKLTVVPLLLGVLSAGLLVAALSAFGLAVRDAPAPPSDSVPRAPRALLLLLFCSGALVTQLLSQRVFHQLPGFGDEVNYLFQGRIFSSGHLSVPAPPDPEFFRVDWMHLFGEDGRIWGFHPPGNSVLLAVGWLLGRYALTLPLVAGLLLCVHYLLALELLRDRTFAAVSAVVVGTSHYVLSLCSSFMAHAPSFLLLSLFYLAFVRFRRTEAPRHLLLASLWLGLAFVVRPVSAVLVGLPPLVVLLFSLRKGLLRYYAIALAIGAALGSTVFLYTWAINGQLTFPYAVKGMEVGQTLMVRLGKGWEYHLTNLFRNFNEFQHRVHSFGIFGNVLFFFVPLVAGWRRKESRWVPLAFFGFLFYVVGHSFLHWYGWKWEPRMIFDVSFLFFLVSGEGLRRVARTGRAGRYLLGAAVALAFGYVAFVDLPVRFRDEYGNYNMAPPGLKKALDEGDVRSGVIFLRDEQAYVTYMTFNSPRFDGPVVYAKALGELYDYRLLARHPEKRAWDSPEGQNLVPRPNFYRHDLATLAEDLGKRRETDALVVIPWLDVAPSPLLDRLPGRRVAPGSFLASLADDGPASRGRFVVFVEGATRLAELVDLLFVTEAPQAPAFEGPVAYRRITGPREKGSKRLPGILMSCYEGTNWAGPPLREQIVSSLDLAPCVGSNRSIRWEAQFDLTESRTLRFSMESDDGSALYIDGDVVIDNDLYETHGPQTRSGSVCLDPGRHSMDVRFFNGPGDERFLLTLEDPSGTALPVSVAAFLPGFYFHVQVPEGSAGGAPR